MTKLTIALDMLVQHSHHMAVITTTSTQLRFTVTKDVQLLSVGQARDRVLILPNNFFLTTIPLQDSVSSFVGVARDGFPIYGPVQWYSASARKVYLNPSNCGDCKLTQMTSNILDQCNGIEVADGSTSSDFDFDKSFLR